MAVTGIDLFIRHFSAHLDKFVLIGGSACHINLYEQGLPFRATKDLDIVLLLDVDRIDMQFAEAFWEFVRLGGYEIQQRTSGKPVFYRFKKPRDVKFPFMLELFSRKLESLELHGGTQCTPVPVEDSVPSLSAILLNDEYYIFITNSLKTIADIPVVTPECLIALKAKAFLDMTAKKAEGMKIDTDDIKKHRNDVFRLSQLLVKERKCVISQQIRNDLKTFTDLIRQEHPDMKTLGLRGLTLDDILSVICNVYGL
jgi:hypothetical protein